MAETVPSRSKRMFPFWLLAAAAVLVLLGANAHLAYVAFSTDPGCVAHIKEKGDAPGEYRAAKSSC
jgi:hypothetical protein